MKKIKLFGVLLFALIFCLISVKAEEASTETKLTEGIFDYEPDENDVAEGYGAFKIVEGDHEGEWIIVKKSELKFEPNFATEFKYHNNTHTIETGNMDEFDEKNQEMIDWYDETIAACEENPDSVSDSNCDIEGLKHDRAELLKLGELIKKYTYVKHWFVRADGITPEDYVVELDAEEYTRLPSSMAMKIELPDDVEKVKDGFTRKYYLIVAADTYEYDVDLVELDDVKFDDDGNISFGSNRHFVTDILVYEDIETPKEEAKEDVEDVKTFDGIVNYVVFTVISLVLVLSAAVYFKKKYN